MLLDTEEIFGHAIQNEKQFFPLPKTAYLPSNTVD